MLLCIVFGDERIPVDTLAEIETARALLKKAGIKRANIFRVALDGGLEATKGSIIVFEQEAGRGLRGRK